MGALSNVATLGLNFALAQQAARQPSGDINRERDRQIREIRRATRRKDAAGRKSCGGVWRRNAPARALRASAAAARPGRAAGTDRGAETDQESSNEAAARRAGDLRRRASQARERNLLELVGGATRSSLGLLGGGSAGARCSTSDQAAPLRHSTRPLVHVEHLHPRSPAARAVRRRRQPHELSLSLPGAGQRRSAGLRESAAATGFSISGIGDPNGGEIGFVTPPAPGTTITLLRRTEGIRETAFVDGGPFRASAINAELDRIMLLIQEDREEHGRALRGHPAESGHRFQPAVDHARGRTSSWASTARAAPWPLARPSCRPAAMPAVRWSPRTAPPRRGRSASISLRRSTCATSALSATASPTTARPSRPRSPPPRAGLPWSTCRRARRPICSAPVSCWTARTWSAMAPARP